jgi:5-methylcytosine-specific restriction endonuclease McrA
MGIDPRDRRIAKLLLWIRQNGRCHYCGDYLDPPDMTIDHMTPRCLGGADALANMAGACYRCNQEKHERRYWNYLRYRRKRGEVI